MLHARSDVMFDRCRLIPVQTCLLYVVQMTSRDSNPAVVALIT